MHKHDHRDEQNFWISYADLMAGLLFVFILVVGAIVVKNRLIQSDLQILKTNLEGQEKALNISKEELLAKREKLSLNSVELESLKTLLLEKENALLTFNNQVRKRESQLKIALLKNKKNEMTLKRKDEEIIQLEKALLVNKRAYQSVVDDLNSTKLKVKNLTGIKIKVVQKLKQKMGQNIVINPKNGALVFSSNILFNQGQARLKPEAKKELKVVLGKYITALLLDKEIRPYIDLITIEGHTNSDGKYLYNLNLSQQRALVVMKFLYKEYPKYRKLFREYLRASGRSFSEPVLDKNGKEDRDASRRIEIKFRIKNQNATQELMNFINKS